MQTKSSLKSDLGWAKVEVKGKQDEINSLTERVEKLESEVSAKNKEFHSALDTVIDVLGLRDSYPDVVTQEKYWVSGISYLYYKSPGYYQEHKVTRYGRDKFLVDIKEAQGAIKSGKALKRIRKALKEAK